MRGEAASLKAMSATAPESLIPRLYGYAESADGNECAMVTQYFDLQPLHGGSYQRELGRKLAEMHRLPPKDTEGYTGRYGFEVPTFCGVTQQDNTWEGDWKTFWRDRRLGDMIRRIEDTDLAKAWDGLLDKAVPLLLDSIQPQPQPVIIHGDLWYGNTGYDQTTQVPVIFDPSSFWGHNEAELGMTKMFGGFTNDFYDAYHEIHPRSERYDQLIQLYELYHHLNHTLMFGTMYKEGALRIMKSLTAWAETV
ncbi:Fructosamine/Ketosamine-3-kinase [Kockovaella imperatae]|uniref:protein-ribulosamine 3-kinase n=1 Tax=Kockovaella imperatae TaxID=4999 RepID=A0A1Y1UKL1_9TREE|nr:Fructosamine/Ketosamine-3-kinase [Kockovaella imperatae]ORX38044.1 Fructosamine/Ketosamine-3-kinase [Kockovaella imperatae]